MLTVAAGIVIYNPEISKLQENIESIRDQVMQIIIYDNGSSNINDVKNMLSIYKDCCFIEGSENSGIAAALNHIFQYAIKHEYNYVLTLDQDSVTPKNLISCYFRYLQKDVAIYTPLIKDVNMSDTFEKPHGQTEFVKRCITSAALTSCSAWKDINGFDESMFIDCVDFDFCDRLIEHHYKIIRVNEVILQHEIGHITYHKFFCFKIPVKNHSSFRKYYIARNTIYLARKHHSFLQEMKAILQILKQILLVIYFEKDKRKKYPHF